jgi:hypothetical protein
MTTAATISARITAPPTMAMMAIVLTSLSSSV